MKSKNVLFHNLIAPFKCLQANGNYAQRLAAPPYDVVTFSEAKSRVYGNKFSFLNVTRPEINFSNGASDFSDHIYQHARKNLESFIDMGAMQVLPEKIFYAYQLITENHSQIGLACGVLVSAYRKGLVKRHELTRNEKEEDRINHIRTVNAQTGPVLLTHKPHTELAKLLRNICTKGTPPEINITMDGDTSHILWPITDPLTIKTIQGLVEDLGALYIADGHHRCAAAEKVATERNDPDARFLGVLFPSDELVILAYNRVLKDLGCFNKKTFLKELERTYTLKRETSSVQPNLSSQIGLCLDDGWWSLDRHIPISQSLPVTERLGVSLIMNDIFSPLFNIDNPRTDSRLDFIGGINSLEIISKEVNSGRAVAGFSLFPTQIEQLIQVADLGKLMPPKSTWFEPKLADGLIVHILD